MRSVLFHLTLTHITNILILNSGFQTWPDSSPSNTIIPGFGSEICPTVNWTTSSAFSLLLTSSILYLQLNIFSESHCFFVFIFILDHKRLYFIDFCHAGMSNKFFGLGFLALGSLEGQTILFCKMELSVCCVLQRQMAPSTFF